MVIKKYHLLAVFAVFFVISVSMILTTHFAVVNASASDEIIVSDSPAADTDEKPATSAVSGNLQVGDIICQRASDKKGALIPGRYSHSQFFIGGNNIVEAQPSGGVHYDVITNGEVYRVSTSSTVKNNAVNWAKTQVGKPYDYWLVSKQVYGSSYYCSEQIWAAYKANGGPDIDQNPGWSWTYANGVAPTELADDGNTYYVGSF